MSKYAQAWAILKEYKEVSLVLDNPRTEKTIRAAITEHKKLDKFKNPLERIKTFKEIKEGKLIIHFKLVPCIRRTNEFLDLTSPLDDSTDLDII